MKKKNGLTLFFTDKFYRWSRIEYFKLKITDFPIVKNIVIWNNVRKFCDRTKNMTNWERYMELKEIEAHNSKIHLITVILNLKTEMAIGEGSKFEEAKSNVLASELINDPKFREFKSWIENLDLAEQDYSKLDEVILVLAKEVNRHEENM